MARASTKRGITPAEAGKFKEIEYLAKMNGFKVDVNDYHSKFSMYATAKLPAAIYKRGALVEKFNSTEDVLYFLTGWGYLAGNLQRLANFGPDEYKTCVENKRIMEALKGDDNNDEDNESW
jgi:hypothetical protein